jgi:flagellar hook-length control protein FliK
MNFLSLLSLVNSAAPQPTSVDDIDGKPAAAPGEPSPFAGLLARFENSGAGYPRPPQHVDAAHEPIAESVEIEPLAAPDAADERCGMAMPADHFVAGECPPPAASKLALEEPVAQEDQDRRKAPDDVGMAPTIDSVAATPIVVGGPQVAFLADNTAPEVPRVTDAPAAGDGVAGARVAGPAAAPGTLSPGSISATTAADSSGVAIRQSGDQMSGPPPAGQSSLRSGGDGPVDTPSLPRPTEQDDAAVREAEARAVAPSVSAMTERVVKSGSAGVPRAPDPSTGPTAAVMAPRAAAASAPQTMPTDAPPARPHAATVSTTAAPAGPMHDVASVAALPTTAAVMSSTAPRPTDPAQPLGRRDRGNSALSTGLRSAISAAHADVDTLAIGQLRHANSAAALTSPSGAGTQVPPDAATALPASALRTLQSTLTQTGEDAPADADDTPGGVRFDSLLPRSGDTASPLTSRQLPALHPLQTMHFGDELSERVLQLRMHGLDRASIALEPADLGRVEIRLRMEGETTHVSFVVHNNAVRDALEAQLPRLRTLLESSGLVLGDADVGQSDRQAGRQPANAPPEPSFYRRDAVRHDPGPGAGPSRRAEDGALVDVHV